MMRRALVVLTVAVGLFACASIDAPAPFDKPDASADPNDSDASSADRCGRFLPRRFATDATARVYGDRTGAQAVCVSLALEVLGAGTGVVTFCVAGDLDNVTLPTTVRDVSAKANCAYCVEAQTGCTIGDAGPLACDNQYLPTSGRVRIVRLGREAGEEVWIDVGDLVLARVTRRDETTGTFELERVGCLFADGLTFQAKLVAATCPGSDPIECRIASTASSRVP
jgi:hypothetical protein